MGARPVLFAFLLVLGPVAAAGAGDTEVLVLPTGQRLACEVLRAPSPDYPFVVVRVGASTYRLEPDGLRRKRGEEEGEDPAWASFVRDLAPRLVLADADLARAARLALLALGPRVVPYLRRAAARAGSDAARAALLRVEREAAGEREAPGEGSRLERILERARESLGLRPEQEGPFAEALGRFLAEVRRGEDPDAARRRLEERLAPLLTPEQRSALEGWFGGGASR